MRITDEEGLTFTQEGFLTNPGLAEDFLEVFETNSLGILPDWRGLTQDEKVREASFRLYGMEQDLLKADDLRVKQMLQ